MSEHWKSTPRYWCKHCTCYVRDTKLERQNHDATAKHQGNLKRFLRDLHREHDRSERDKERAQQEIARLNGVTSGTLANSTPSVATRPATRPAKSAPVQSAFATEADLKRQREQLAEMGIAVPEAFRPDMAIAGEWTVTKTRVIDDDASTKNLEATAIGVRKREATEDEVEEERDMRNLFKKSRRWGRDTKSMPENEDKELDALLAASSLPRTSVKFEERPQKAEEGTTEDAKIKREDDDTEASIDSVKLEHGNDSDNGRVKIEHEETQTRLGLPFKAESGTSRAESEPISKESEAPGIVFKKRKPREGMRHR